jgi:hypothetical protein
MESTTARNLTEIEERGGGGRADAIAESKMAEAITCRST